MDVLAEEDALPLPVEVERDGARGVPGGVDAVQLIASRMQGSMIAVESDVDRGFGQPRSVPRCRRYERVAGLYCSGIEVVSHDSAPEGIVEIFCRPDVVHMAVGQDEGGDP